MPFQSKAQARAAFGGYLGPEMKAKAREFASKTDFNKIPEHAHRGHRAMRERHIEREFHRQLRGEK